MGEIELVNALMAAGAEDGCNPLNVVTNNSCGPFSTAELLPTFKASPGARLRCILLPARSSRRRVFAGGEEQM